MPDEFVPLHLALAKPANADASPACAEIESESTPLDAGAAETTAGDALTAQLGSEIRRFRAALADALQAQLADLLRDIACDVLARELELAPADVATIAAVALDRFASEAPLRLRANPADVPALAGAAVPPSPDPSLRRGDLVVELQHGTIDARLGMRLSAILDRR